MIDTSVKYFHSELQGAPVLNGTAGSFISLLDACLVNGFGLKTVDTLLVSGGIATLTIGTGHSFEKDTVALISGATPAGLNGEKKIISASGNSATFDATGIADQTATGTITARLASARWAKPFSGTNLAAYVSADPQANGRYLRVDDTAAQDVRIVGYESMSAISTGVNAFPTNTQQSGGLYIGKSSASGAAARQWLLFADSRFVYFCLGVSASSPNFRSIHGFGDIVPSSLSTDPYSTVIAGSVVTDSGATSSSTTYSQLSGDASSFGNAGTYIARPYTGLGNPVLVRQHSDSLGSNAAYASGAGQHAYPNPSDNGIYLTNVIAIEQNTINLRGTFPGQYFTPQGIPVNAFQNKDRVQNAAGISNRSLIAVNTNGSSAGIVFFDVTGPWR